MFSVTCLLSHTLHSFVQTSLSRETKLPKPQRYNCLRSLPQLILSNICLRSRSQLILSNICLRSRSRLISSNICLRSLSQLILSNICLPSLSQFILSNICLRSPCKLTVSNYSLDKLALQPNMPITSASMETFLCQHPPPFWGRGGGKSV